MANEKKIKTPPKVSALGYIAVGTYINNDRMEGSIWEIRNKANKKHPELDTESVLCTLTFGKADNTKTASLSIDAPADAAIPDAERFTEFLKTLNTTACEDRCVFLTISSDAVPENLRSMFEKAGFQTDPVNASGLLWELPLSMYIPIGMCLGTSIGICFGTAMGEGKLGIGMCIGIALGVAWGSLIDYMSRREREKLKSSRK